ncbi:MAG: hypothetical protein ACE5H8_02205 [Alphaproteobacteria bacterium]
MPRVVVMTPVIGSGRSAEDAHRPQVSRDYKCARCTDITGDRLPAGRRRSPNLMLAEIEITVDQLTMLKADARYHVMMRARMMRAVDKAALATFAGEPLPLDSARTTDEAIPALRTWARTRPLATVARRTI